MNLCPCCSDRLLRHVRHNSIYWFCSRCHQEMPVLESAGLDNVDREFQLLKQRWNTLLSPTIAVALGV